MNFDFLENGTSTPAWMQEKYKKMGQILRDAECLYWEDPRACGILIREAAVEICRVYDRFYEVGFDSGASMEEYLCYTGDDAHNILVSRFLSVVRKEQRDRLTKLRVLGDDCQNGRGEEEMTEFENRMAGNAKRMMETMMGTLAVMCEKINGQTFAKELRFEEGLIPERKQKELPKEEKQSFFSKLFKK